MRSLENPPDGWRDLVHGVRSEDKGRCGPSHERLPFGETTSADHLCYEIELLD